ncbi:unnamed protein product [Diatraea saccharalis]|uniref:Generative cell specific-1/HAP2 domain-containing protein n=1 Tax=Diatraea saccharalis TaxID=40085 RepID=A0A9N9N2R4_9NEOP|nr:unnamed protein product [Diatraea saccharalis]
MDDIVNMGDENPLSKRDGNRSEDTTDSIMEEQHHRRVLIRVSRALLAGNEDDIKISSNGSNKFLVMPYRRIHRAQIDLEARADSNELIRVGSSGSLITIVADNSRRTRSSLTVQATNKGLAAARFRQVRVKVRDCSPDVNDMIRKSSEQLITDPVLIAPRHTHRFVVELPLELPLDVTHCSIALVNDEDESIAVREVAIKKGDRCFCIWHCDCVCLDEDPKLLCREMADARQVAAGLSPRGRARRARFACYPDILCVNISVIIMGVLVALLMLGLLKAISGLFFHCIAKWGLYRLIQTPRKLEKYHEYCLKNRNVVYDDEGWPVHPDTKKRTVRLLSKEMEFVLNLIFFIAVPSLMLWDAIKWLRCVTSKAKKETRVADDKMRCFSTQDMQVRDMHIIYSQVLIRECSSTVVRSHGDDGSGHDTIHIETLKIIMSHQSQLLD